MVFIYSIGISLLTLSVPIAVQLLIDTVANTGLFRAVLMIALLLSLLLAISAVLYALRDYAMELFKRRIYAVVYTSDGQFGSGNSASKGHEALWAMIEGVKAGSAPVNFAAAGRGIDELVKLNGQWLIRMRDVAPQD